MNFIIENKNTILGILSGAVIGFLYGAVMGGLFVNIFKKEK